MRCDLCGNEYDFYQDGAKIDIKPNKASAISFGINIKVCLECSRLVKYRIWDRSEERRVGKECRL